MNIRVPSYLFSLPLSLIVSLCNYRVELYKNDYEIAMKLLAARREKMRK